MVSKSNKKFSELGLIEYLRSILSNNNPSVVKGIGDDAAVIRINKDLYLLNTSDMLIEDRHFRRAQSLSDIGHKAIACSVSDIAAMGGVPEFALVSLGLPKRFRLIDVKLLYKGLKSTAKRFGVDIIGGDTNSSDKLIIDVSMIGFIKPKHLVLRSGAKVGDYIFVTGSLGGSIYKKHLKFTPRLKEALYLTNRFKLHSMIDISDGIALDLWRILRASKVGAVIFQDLIPRSRDAKNLDQVLHMGEDFELLFTVSEKDGRVLIDEINNRKLRFDLNFIGKIIDDRCQLWLLDTNNKLKKLKPKGFTHF